jgi:hypothetical protein
MHSVEREGERKREREFFSPSAPLFLKHFEKHPC